MKQIWIIFLYTLKDAARKKAFKISTVILLVAVLGACLIINLTSKNDAEQDSITETEQESDDDQKETEGIIYYVDSENVIMEKPSNMVVKIKDPIKINVKSATDTAKLVMKKVVIVLEPKKFNQKRNKLKEAELELDKETIAAGLLHDVLEDTIMTEKEMEEEFGKEVVLLVDGVTKLKHLHFTDNIKNPKDKNADRLEMQAENLHKMFLAMAKDIRVIMIKLADRLHNMRSLNFLSIERQQRMARETLDVYAPLADRLPL